MGDKMGSRGVDMVANSSHAGALGRSGPNLRGFGGVMALGGQQLIILALILVLGGGIYLYQPAFLSIRSLDNILRMTSMYGIAALGMTLVIITGGIDLSVGSMIALGGALGAGLLGTAFGAANPLQFPPLIAILMAIAAVGTLGAMN